MKIYQMGRMNRMKAEEIIRSDQFKKNREREKPKICLQ